MGYKAFEGFTLNGIHSSALNIVRINEGSDFSKELLPSVADKTIKVSGRDGTYFFGRELKSRSLTINFAYDKMTEANIAQLQQIMTNKNPIPLILDETPYKTYYVLPNSGAKLNYICYETDEAMFDEIDENTSTVISEFTAVPSGSTWNSNITYYIKDSQNNYKIGKYTSGFPTGYYTRVFNTNQATLKLYGRIYKGTGSISFTLYDIYGYASGEQKYTSSNYYTNHYDSYDIAEWNDLIKLKSSLSGYDTWDPQTRKFKVYNPGEIATPPIMRFQLQKVSGRTNGLNMTIQYNNTVYLDIEELMPATTTAAIEINNKLKLIRGLDAQGEYDGTIYNGYLVGQYFFSLPCDNSTAINELSIIIPNTSTTTRAASGYTVANATISYNYLFW